MQFLNVDSMYCKKKKKWHKNCWLFNRFSWVSMNPAQYNDKSYTKIHTNGVKTHNSGNMLYIY